MCMYVCMYVCTYVYAYMYVCTYICVGIIYVCFYVYMYVCTYLCVSIYIYRYECLETFIFRVWQKPLDTLYFTFLQYYQVTFVPSGLKPKSAWPVIFLRSQGDNQNSDIALNHVVLSEWLVSRQTAFRLAWDYGSDLAAVFMVGECAISVRGKHINYKFLK